MKYEITKEQILILKNGYRTEKLLEWFPEAFKPVLEVGKWYKSYINTLCFYSGEKSMYGISDCGTWNDAIIDKQNFEMCCSGVWELATESEVFEALKNEAVKRGYKEGVYYKLPNSSTTSVCGNQMMLNERNISILYFGYYCIFKEGKWAEIIETITKAEAEKLLNKKII